MAIANLKALAYNILKEFEDPIVSGKDLSELNCSECNKKIISSPHIKSFTTLKCGHTFHRLCLEKKILLAYPNVCPYPNCDEKLDLIEFPRRDSESSGISSIAGNLEKNLGISSLDTMDEIMEEDDEEDDSALQPTDPNSNTVTTATTNPNTIANTSTTSTLPSKRVGDPTSTNKATGKKQKANKEDSLKLKKLINELLSIEKLPQIIEVAEEGVSGGDANNYLYFFNKIDFAESKNIITNQEVIGSYFDFGGVLYKRYKDLKKDNGKEASKALVFEEVRNQIPKEVSDVALRKRMERVRKIYKLFTAIVNGDEKLAKDKIALIRSFSANSLSKLSQSDIDFVIVKVLKKGK